MNRTTRSALALVAAAALVTACQRPDQLPEMGVSQPTLAFEAPGSAGEPAPQTIYVVNTGRGSLSAPVAEIAYQDRAGWLAATVNGDAAPFAVAVQATSAGLDPGVYRATVTLSCAGSGASPSQVSVTLTVPDPRFTLSAQSLAMDAPRGGADPAPAAFQVVNAGRGAIPVPSLDVAYAGTATGWLTTSVAAASAGYTVTAQARVAGVPSGLHHATLTVRAAGAAVPPRTIPVTLTVPPPEVVLSSREVAMRAPSGGLDVTASLAVTNAGGGLLATPVVTVTYGGGPAASWDGLLDVAVSGTPGLYRLTLTAHQVRSTPAGPSRLPPGTYTATVQVSAPGAAASDAARVTLEVPAPVIQLSSSEVAFSEYTSCPLPAPSTVTVANVGGSTLAAPVVVMEPGVDAWLASSAAMRGPDSYAVTLRPIAYPPVQPGGAAETTVMITDPTGLASAVPVRVRFDALATDLATATLTPSQVKISAQVGMGEPTPRTVSLRTPAACVAPVVTVEATDGFDPVSWLSATVLASSPHRYDLSVLTSIAGLAAGDRRTAMLHLRILDRTWDVPVTLTAETFSPAGPLQAAPTREPRLTPLADGRALLTGEGAGAQVFDPATRIWTAIGAPLKERYGHGTVELDGGRVLMCGGMVAAVDQSGRPTHEPTSSCEVMTASGWATTSPLSSKRGQVTLVEMPRGRVLAVGRPQQGPSTPEVLDLATGRWSPLSGISASTVTTRPDGSILVADENGSTWLYAPELDAWSPAGQMAYGHPYGALIPLPGGRVLSVGGKGWWNPDSPDRRTEIWDPATRTWSPSATALSFLWEDRRIAQLASGKVLAAAAPGHEVFDPVSETWSASPGYGSVVRSYAAAATLASGMVLVVGGSVREGDTWVSTLETFTW